MRFVIGAAFALALTGLASAQPPARKPPPAAATDAAQSYAKLPEAERKSIQSDLIWTGDYAGSVDGDFGLGSINAVKAYQKRIKAKDTGVLTPQERTRLGADATKQRDAAGWHIVIDATTGARLGVPAKITPLRTAIASGSRFGSARADVGIETFRIAAPGTTLQGVYDIQRGVTARKISYQVMRDGFFVVAGTQGTQKIYVRAQEKAGEVRGYSLYYEQALAARIDPIAIAMSSAFEAFPAGVAVAPLARRKVEYGTGVFVSNAGDIITSRELIDGCITFNLTGHGPADLVAQDKDSGLALLRIYGARELKAAALADATGLDATLVGIADPSRQSGGSAVSVATARLTAGAAGARATVTPAPVLGFGGAGALDREGRLLGIIELPPAQAVAGPPGAASGTATLIPSAAIKTFLAAQKVTANGTAAGLDHAKAATVRVICVRK